MLPEFEIRLEPRPWWKIWAPRTTYRVRCCQGHGWLYLPDGRPAEFESLGRALTYAHFHRMVGHRPHA